MTAGRSRPRRARNAAPTWSTPSKNDARPMNTLELFADEAVAVPLGPGISLLRGFADSTRLMPLIESLAAASPFRHLVTPGGQTMSVAMTNCGAVGWVSDRGGYRYDARDPLTLRAWPHMPAEFLE